jgi:hypothetical protein
LDVDGNGGQDLLLRNYFTKPELLRNRGGSNHWVSFEMEGTRSNRDAVGARVRLRKGDRWQTRVVATGTGYLSSSSRRQHFGLGRATRVDQVVIDWPSGAQTNLQDLEVDRLHRIVEAKATTAESF